jgi:hypothetical protein
VTVSDQASEYIDHQSGQTAVTGMFNLRDVLELLIDAFQDGPLPFGTRFAFGFVTWKLIVSGKATPPIPNTLT